MSFALSWLSVSLRTSSDFVAAAVRPWTRKRKSHALTSAATRRPAQNGFTLLEMMITLAVFLLLAGAVFGLLGGVLQSTATLQQNQDRSDQITALQAYLKTRLTEMPARSTIASYQRGQGEGLTANGIVFGNTNLAHAVDAKVQPNGLYVLRVTSFATTAGSDQPQDARQVLLQSVTTEDPTLTWRVLVSDVKTLAWKFQDLNLAQWVDTWTTANTPNLIEFMLQTAGDINPTTMDFWVPKINPVSVRIQAAPNTTGGTNQPPPPRPGTVTPGGTK